MTLSKVGTEVSQPMDHSLCWRLVLANNTVSLLKRPFFLDGCERSFHNAQGQAITKTNDSVFYSAVMTQGGI